MPHAFSELEGLVSPEVAERLDSGVNYGVFYYGRRQCSSTAVAERGPDGERRYRRRQEYVYRPREEWIAIPVPDIGVPREIVESARRSLEGNKRPSSAGDRFWDLSGGVLFCSGCGRRMSPDRRTNSSGSSRVYFYYRCPKRRIMGIQACPNNKTLRAEKAEAAVWEVVRGLLTDPERLRRGLEEMIRVEKSHAAGDPAREAPLWASKVEQIERKRSGFQDMAAEGLITFHELREKLEALSRDHERAKAELETIADRGRKLKALERDASEILGSYASTIPNQLEALGPEERHRVYKLLKLRAEAQRDGSVKMRGVLDTVARPCVTPTKSHARKA